MEFRIFRGTLKRNTLLASLELVDKIFKERRLYTNAPVAAEEEV